MKIKEWTEKHPKLVNGVKIGAAIIGGYILGKKITEFYTGIGFNAMVNNGFIALTKPEMDVESIPIEEWLKLKKS